MRRVLLTTMLVVTCTLYAQITPGRYMDNEGLIWELNADGTCTIENRFAWSGQFTWFCNPYDEYRSGPEGMYKSETDPRELGILHVMDLDLVHSEMFYIYPHPELSNAYILALVVHSVAFDEYIKLQELGYWTWLRRIN